MKQCDEIEEKKQYLKQYQYAMSREKKIVEEIQRLKMDRVSPAIVNDSMARGASFRDLSDYIVLVEEEIDKLKYERLEKIRRYRDIENRIKDIGDTDEQETLRLRYISGLPWEKVADEMGFTYRHIMRKHNDALNNFKLS